MKKNKLYILSSILIIISLFATAVTCNLCGTPLDISLGDTETTEEEGSPASQREPTETTQASQGAEATVEGNHSPVIKEIEMMGGVDVEFLEAEGNFDTVHTEEGMEEVIPITIEAYDEDGDELTYQAYDSLGINFDITKTDNNNAEFIWVVPVLSGAYTLTIEVSDGKGETVTRPIEMNLIEYVADDDGAVDFAEPVNNPPVIDNELIIRGPAGVVTILYTNQVFELSVFVSDPDGHAVTRTWSADAGEFHTEPTFPTVHWKTPGTSGDCVISLTVNDSHGGIVTESWTVPVQDH